MNYIKLRLKHKIPQMFVFVIITILISLFVLYLQSNLVKNDAYKVAIVDNDKSELSETLIKNLEKNDELFIVRRNNLAQAEADLSIKNVDFVISILAGFEKNINKNVYEDSIDVYFLENDTSTDLIEDNISTEVIRVWTDVAFDNLDNSKAGIYKDVKVDKYLDLIINKNDGFYEKKKSRDIFVLFWIFIILISIFYLIIFGESHKESINGLKQRLKSFGISKNYAFEKIIFIFLVIIQIVISLLLCYSVFNRRFDYYFVKLGMVFIVIAILYALWFFILSFILNKLIKSISKFYLTMEILVLLSILFAIFPTKIIISFLSPIKLFTIIISKFF